MVTACLVSGADRGYFRCLWQLLCSVQRQHGTGLRCIVYDLGLDATQRAELVRKFPSIEVRCFDFSSAPEHMRIRPRPINSNAWKPSVIDDVLRAATGPVLWLDSACVLCAPLDPVFAQIERDGVYAPQGGSSSIGELTDPRTLSFMACTPDIARHRQRASGVFGADPRSPLAMRVVSRWAELARLPECIAPSGATLATHRFDQSVLNVLLQHAVRDHGLCLTRDEIDVSSDKPTPLYRTRNKLPAWMPHALDPVLRAMFATRRAADVTLLRMRRSSVLRAMLGALAFVAACAGGEQPAPPQASAPQADHAPTPTVKAPPAVAKPAVSGEQRLRQGIEDLYRPPEPGFEVEVRSSGAPLPIHAGAVIDVDFGSGHGHSVTFIRLRVGDSAIELERAAWRDEPSGAVATLERASARDDAAASLLQGLSALPTLEASEVDTRSEADKQKEPTLATLRSIGTSNDFFVRVRVAGTDGVALFERAHVAHSGDSAQLATLPLLAMRRLIEETLDTLPLTTVPQGPALRTSHVSDALAHSDGFLLDPTPGFALDYVLQALAHFGNVSAVPVLERVARSYPSFQQAEQRRCELHSDGPLRALCMQHSAADAAVARRQHAAAERETRKLLLALLAQRETYLAGPPASLPRP